MIPTTAHTPVEPDRATVEVFQRGMGCVHSSGTDFRWPGRFEFCLEHQDTDWTDLGCPAAVAAARTHLTLMTATLDGQCDPFTMISADRDALRAVIEQVRALHSEDPDRCQECWQATPCGTLELLPRKRDVS